MFSKSPLFGQCIQPEDLAAALHDQMRGDWRPQFIVLHNTSAPTLAQWPSCPGPQRMDNLVDFYSNVQYWHAGPHFFVAPEGVYPFSDLTRPGVSSPSWNDVCIGVEMVGEYMTESFGDGPGAQVAHNAVMLLAVLSIGFGLDSSSLRLHRADPLTTHKLCPGNNVVKADVIQRVHDEIIRFHAAASGS